jgi:hypothetical protein
LATRSKLVSLFPYQIKRRDSFYNRNHPENIHPDSPVFKKYWALFIKRCIEGFWINDEGTWVFMMPKLFFYINYPLIADKDRNNIPPDLRDNEWIIFTYFLCLEGFSGFEEDHDYTCHNLVKKYENDPDSLTFVDLKKIPDNVKKFDGTYKKYVEPWYYLTRHYLLDHVQDRPLGQALYGNRKLNGCILSARSIGKSLCSFVGDFLHEILTGGIKRYDDIGNVNKRLLFGLGSAMKPQLQRSINNIRFAYYNMPGQYLFKDVDKSSYNGPLFKKVQGSWEVGHELNHIVKSKNGNVEIQGSNVQMVALTKDRTAIGAGDRFRRIYVEEFGFLENAIDVHGSNKDSLQSEGERVGSSIYLGTGGNLKKIRQPKEIFEHPDVYDMFGIPDYWAKNQKRVGLFIPYTYALRDYKDDQGNTLMELAYDTIIEKREADKRDKDSISYELDIMFNPLEPKEMLRPSNSTLLPRQEAQEQLNKLESYDIFRKRAQIGKMVWNPIERCGVEWRKDMSMTMKPILETKIDDTITFTNKEGAVIIYEQPPEHIPEDLYWVLYDPAARSGDGESFHSILIYKHFYSGSEKTMYDTIVAEWIGRKETLEENYQEVIKLAKYFNARIFPEINVAGFVEYCRKNNYSLMLEGDAFALEQEIHGKAAVGRSYYRVGFQMSKRKKNWALKRLRDWLLEVKEVDAISGAPMVRTMDWILSPRILNEIVEYVDDPNENFDHVSSLLGLMLLIGKLDGRPPVDLDDVEDDRHDSQLIPYINKHQNIESTSTRCEFLNY